MASPLLAAILSFFIPGLGQLYAGHFLRGVLVFIVAGVLALLSAAIILVGLLAFIYWRWNIIDAYQLASKQSPVLVQNNIYNR